ncbi:sensor histidine kinase [Vallitalea guaymasensis]|uniref:histidine kinase n=1 Tax=Vallitalea guaymasensis TaxID=1185412 RepID=A0A8J8MEU9_9FIRM|nr:histidine kinase [Vallitalea guaymasensis]QUH31814.1 histidine kinase [Vallitalea guaymasensis]
MNAIVHKLKSRLKIFDSIKNKLILYVTIVFILVIGSILLANINFKTFFGEYNSLYNKYNALNSFYSNINESTEHIKSYYYNKDKEDLDKYLVNISIASRKIKYLQSTSVDEDTRWEYKKLSNMLDTYKEKIDLALEDSFSNNIVHYETIVNINELINRTMIKYYNVIIDEMNASGETLQANWQTQRYTTSIIILIIIIFCIVFSILFIRGINKPIGQLVRGVKKILRGNYNIPKIKGGGEEIQILANAFNKMASSLGYYVREMQEKAKLQGRLLEQENDNLKMQHIIRETELRALQSQMNPHFLFNTLSIISKMAYIESAPKTCELMEATTELLRYNIDKSSKVSDLNSEIQCLKNYLYIQRKRFGERIKFELDCEKDLPNVKMPALIIQPIVENAIVHGVDNMVSDGLISINIFMVKDVICISVEDNGIGIDSEKIDSILSFEKDDEDSSGIGVINVKKRLEMFFGMKKVFNIESSSGCGTVVTINLPLTANSEELLSCIRL